MIVGMYERWARKQELQREQARQAAETVRKLQAIAEHSRLVQEALKARR